MVDTISTLESSPIPVQHGKGIPVVPVQMAGHQQQVKPAKEVKKNSEKSETKKRKMDGVLKAAPSLNPRVLAGCSQQTEPAADISLINRNYSLRRYLRIVNPTLCVSLNENTDVHSITSSNESCK